MMTARLLAGLTVLCAGFVAQALFAQEGHPMKGTWHGTWGPNATDRTPVTLVLDWDGDNVTGIMNPGLRTAQLQKVNFEADGWKFHFEADYKDRAGKVSHVTVDAHLEDVTNRRRKLVGTYSKGSEKGDFKAQRDD